MIDRIRQILTGGAALGDVQLFSQLKALGEIKTALNNAEFHDQPIEPFALANFEVRARILIEQVNVESQLARALTE